MPTAADPVEKRRPLSKPTLPQYCFIGTSPIRWADRISVAGSPPRRRRNISSPAGDVAALLARFAELNRRALARTGKSFPIVLHPGSGPGRLPASPCLESDGIESDVVDPASIATSRRRRRQTDRIDGEALRRALLAESRRTAPRVTVEGADSPEEEDRRRLSLASARCWSPNGSSTSIGSRACVPQEYQATSLCAAIGAKGSTNS